MLQQIKIRYVRRKSDRKLYRLINESSTDYCIIEEFPFAVKNLGGPYYMKPLTLWRPKERYDLVIVEDNKIQNN